MALLRSTEIFARRGYVGAELTELVAACGLDRFTFESHFTDKEGCFLAAYDLLVAEATSRVAAAAAAAQASWTEQLSVGLYALFQIIDEQPAAAQLVLREPMFVSSNANTCRVTTLRTAAKFMHGGRAHSQQPIPPMVDMALVGGVAFMISRQLEQHRREPVLKLYSETLRVLLIPYLSEPQAGELVADACVRNFLDSQR